MYIPASFAESNPAELHEFIERHSFGMLVSQQGGQLVASHLPILLDRKSSPRGCLYGHMARANPQWRDADGTEVLMIFSGPHAYISPSWYETDNIVPTWNYVAVHAYGRFHAIEDQLALVEIVRDSVDFFERGLPRPWTLEESHEDLERRLRMVVGFRIDLTRLEGKWKLGQNHSAARRQKVIQALNRYPDDNAQAVAALMQATLEPKPDPSQDQ
jgi:transcriptional regulator